MLADDIRRSFLRFYEERDHRVYPSAPLIPTDPTLMFTIAGVIPFKPYLEGREQPPHPRAASVQKCFRTENIEDVGENAKDCTFFEMLGNWSFGDYFKEEACSWAWELLTETFEIDVDRLWASILEGDEETRAIWQNVVGVDPSRIVPFPKEDNFWHMGVPGPCGPCTEIYIDRGPSYGPAADDGPVGSPARYQEIYNLVFMQYIQDEPFHVVGELDKTGVDTGMGLERIAQILQNVDSVWDIDEIAPLVVAAEEITGISRGERAADRTLQIVTDHSRSAAFLIGDGVTPSNEGRGYVLRRVLRRAMTEARLSGYSGPVLRPMTERVIEAFGGAYPELVRNREAITSTVDREEKRFAQTLDAGLTMLEDEIRRASGKLDGSVAFQLHDTYGFPLDITKDVAARAGLSVDEEGFGRLMEEQRSRSRAITESEKRSAVTHAEIDVAPTEFLGYHHLDAQGTVVAIVSGVAPIEVVSAGEEADVVLDRTPFYPEGGGQIGDRGFLSGTGVRAEVLDTQRLGAAYLHRVRVTDGEIRVGSEVELHVNHARRAGAEQAHTATHVLHHTLRNVLGEHVRQMGSLVEPGRLRFDFAHFSNVDRDAMAEIEETVNARVSEDDKVVPFETSYQDAIDRYHAMAFFEEKYGDVVRVVGIGDYSYELCGGTHVPQTGHIGFVKLLGEGSIGSNIRRVEALTGVEGLKWVNERLSAAQRAAELVRVPPEELVSGVERLLKTQKDLQKQLDAQQRSGVAAATDELVAQARDVGKGRLIVAQRSEGADVLRGLAASVRDKIGPSIVILGSAQDGSPKLVAAVTKSLDINAKDLLQPAAQRIGGGAGGKPDLAMAGGRDADGLDEALQVAAKEAEAALTR